MNMAERDSEQLTTLTVDDVMNSSDPMINLLWDASLDCGVRLYGETSTCAILLDRAVSAGITNLTIYINDEQPHLGFVGKDNCDCEYEEQ